MIARALYRNPKIIYLDEGTANLDMSTEASIAIMIRNQNITRVLIGHRPALMNLSDRIIGIKDSTIRIQEIERDAGE